MKAFFEARVGVKGLVDSGITKIPSIFIHPPETNLPNPSFEDEQHLQIPEIDLQGFESEPIRTKIVDAIRDAAQTWGIFRMVNHGVPISIMENMLEGVCQFHEQPLEEILCELLAEALGLKSDYLASLQAMKGALIACHYHPACPEPELTLGTSSHTDASFLTILLESNVDGLQVLHQGQWVDVPHRHGYLIANIGDFLQIVSNDKFRVLAGRVGPRISAACFFAPTPAYRDEPIGPAKELVSEKTPPIYRELSFLQYLPYFRSKGRDGTIALPHFKLST
ncbi:Oxoglutarate/iron-dependent dioxygenase [Corchorus olitorius]|uniref:Oxoglutarate/iron-dependent dioxygenase n=1 Tax=Corchorus olitorius TaxID=93759 RepID=A0A1R3GZZ2_9ROSI|nr:Oxoglutarate/iron-dependent dioxygenase [Corchorus olitorius]